VFGLIVGIRDAFHEGNSSSKVVLDRDLASGYFSKIAGVVILTLLSVHEPTGSPYQQLVRVVIDQFRLGVGIMFLEIVQYD